MKQDDNPHTSPKLPRWARMTAWNAALLEHLQRDEATRRFAAAYPRTPSPKLVTIKENQK